jgi:hypothetical protein
LTHPQKGSHRLSAQKGASFAFREVTCPVAKCTVLLGEMVIVVENTSMAADFGKAKSHQPGKSI